MCNRDDPAQPENETKPLGTRRGRNGEWQIGRRTGRLKRPTTTAKVTAGHGLIYSHLESSFGADASSTLRVSGTG
jgi:hypothetical protein